MPMIPINPRPIIQIVLKAFKVSIKCKVYILSVSCGDVLAAAGGSTRYFHFVYIYIIYICVCMRMCLRLLMWYVYESRSPGA